MSAPSRNPVRSAPASALVALLSLAGAIACSGKAPATMPPMQQCSPGQIASCPCPGNQQGQITCPADGQWGSDCECPGYSDALPLDATVAVADAFVADASVDLVPMCALTCKDVGKNCGVVSDNCGGTINCGGCPAPGVCQANNVCSGTVPVVVAAMRNHPLSVRADATSIYWIDAGDLQLDGSTRNGALLKVAKSGGAVTVLASGLTSPGDLALDATDVYFTVGGTPGGTSGTIARVALDGSAPAVTIATGQSFPTGIAVDGTSVYWLNQDIAAQQSPSSSVEKMALSGGAPKNLGAAGIASRLVVEGSYLYWTAGGPSGAIMRVTTDGLGIQALATKQAEPNDLVLDATWVYFTNGDANGTGQAAGRGVSKTLKAGGGSAIPVATNIFLDQPYGIALYDGWLYYTCFGTLRATTTKGQLRRIDITGANDQVIVDGLDHPTYLVRDGNSLDIALAGKLSATTNDGAVLRLY